TLLGKSLKILVDFRHDIVANVVPSNTAGLPEVYNTVLARADDDETILFVHDDVWFDDIFLVERLEEALSRFEVIGVAGNVGRAPRQAGWQLLDDRGTHDVNTNWSGAVIHLNTEANLRQLTFFGPCPRQVRLLDGVFLAAQVRTLRQSRVTF